MHGSQCDFLHWISPCLLDMINILTRWTVAAGCSLRQQHAVQYEQQSAARRHAAEDTHARAMHVRNMRSYVGPHTALWAAVVSVLLRADGTCGLD